MKSVSAGREILLSMCQQRLAELLRNADNPERDRLSVGQMLEQADLWQGRHRVLQEKNPVSFAVTVLEENPLLFDAVGSLQHEFEPKASETVENLISNLLPSDGHLANRCLVWFARALERSFAFLREFLLSAVNLAAARSVQ